MAKILSFLSWNVEHFHNDQTRVARVVSAIAAKAPDVFAIYEVKGSAVFTEMRAQLPDYAISITESASPVEILVGVRNSLFGFVTQRDELQSKVPTLRPGALATIDKGGALYSFLFLHLKSFDDPRDWGLRDDMIQHVCSLKRTIERGLPGDAKANFVALGDINTMGMSAAYNNDLDIDGAKELEYMDKRLTAGVNGMRRLPKTHAETWWNGKDNWAPSSLDHVFAADHLNFKSFAGGAEVDVTGWVEEPTTAAKKDWIDNFSDHAMLYGEIVD